MLTGLKKQSEKFTLKNYKIAIFPDSSLDRMILFFYQNFIFTLHALINNNNISKNQKRHSEYLSISKYIAIAAAHKISIALVLIKHTHSLMNDSIVQGFNALYTWLVSQYTRPLGRQLNIVQNFYICKTKHGPWGVSDVTRIYYQPNTETLL